jgi:hypothetical protein
MGARVLRGRPFRMFLAASLLALALTLPLFLPPGPFGEPPGLPVSHLASLPPDPTGKTPITVPEQGQSAPGALSPHLPPRPEGFPLCPGLPDPLTGTYSTNASGGPCTIEGNLTVAPTGTLVIWGTSSLLLVNTSRSTTDPIVLRVDGSLRVGGGGLLQVGTGTPASLSLTGSVRIDPGSTLALDSSSQLDLQANSSLAIDGGFVFLDGASVAASGGTVTVAGGGVWEGSTSVSPIPPRVAHLDVAGTLAALVVTGSAVESLNLSGVGNLTVLGADVTNLTITGSVGSMSLVGFYTRLSQVAGVTVSSVSDFRADDANLTSVLLDSAGNVTLGNPSTPEDQVGVYGLTVASPGLEDLSIAHAQLTDLALSGVRNVTVFSSTVGAGAASLTAASGNLTVRGVSRFQSPLVISGGPAVTLVNVSAPGLLVSGPANVEAVNWPGNTTNATGPFPALPSISVTNHRASVEVSRYVLLRVVIPGGALPPPGSSVLICNQVLPGTPCQTVPLNGTSAVGLFLLTDRVTFGGDTFLGRYTFAASGPGYPASPVTVAITRADTVLSLSMTAPVLPPQIYPYLLAEGAGLVAVALGIVWLRRRMRGRRETPSGGGSNPPQDLSEGALGPGDLVPPP